MIALALALSVMVQDTNSSLSPRVRVMIDRFPPPRPGLPSISILFSRDSVWVGEQVELVTATWFPRAVRDQLRRLPVISSPSLTGLWSARNQQLPIQAASRLVGNQVYDLYISWQTIFPLGPGRIEAPPATLTYNLPTSTAYFAPEERKVFKSTVATLVVRAIPPPSAALLGVGPTGHDLHSTWRVPANTLRTGLPALVELSVSGQGNLTLWPAPMIKWPTGLHVYPEPTLEHQTATQGLIGGEKRFRFTIVADSAGVLTLPAVQYPFFDPGPAQVQVPAAAALTLAILPRALSSGDTRALAVLGSAEIPLASRVVHDWWPLLALLALLPPVIVLAPRRRRTRVIAPVTQSDPEAALRLALGTPVDAGEEHVVAALRARGVSRDEAEHIHRWLGSVGRRRYGPNKSDVPEPPPILSKVIARLLQASAIVLVLGAAAPLQGQQEDAVARFNGGDYAGAARVFETYAHAHPAAAGSWRDLGTARWLGHDDVGAAAAWLHALALAPRDPLLRDAWRGATTIPPDVRSRAPMLPVSRDELLLAALALWWVAWLAGRFHWRRTVWLAGTACALVSGVIAIRWWTALPGQALITANATLRISPHPATMGVGELPAWSAVRIERRIDNWVLVDGQLSSPGSIGALSIQGWVPASAVATVGPLD